MNDAIRTVANPNRTRNLSHDDVADLEHGTPATDATPDEYVTW